MLIFIVGQSLGINWWWNNYRGSCRNLLFDQFKHKECVLPFAKKVVLNYGLRNNFGQLIYQDQLVDQVKYYFERDCHECRGKFEFHDTWKNYECVQDENGKVKCLLPIPNWTNPQWIYQGDQRFDEFVFSSWFCTDIKSSNPACKQIV